MNSDRRKIFGGRLKIGDRPLGGHTDGMVEEDIIIDAEDLVAKLGGGERLYRHRCVEAWAMAVPWTVFH